MDFRKVVVWAATIFVGAIFLLVGSSKIVQSAMWQQRFVTQWGLPAWLAVATGFAEVAGAVLILMPRRAVYGGSIIAVVMIGATVVHAVTGELANIPVTATLGGFAAFVAWFRCPWCAREQGSDDE